MTHQYPRGRALVIATCSIAAVINLGARAASPSDQSRAPDWHANKKLAAQFDIDSNMAAERTSLAVPPAPGDTEWPYYNNRINGNRYSSLNEINAGNIAKLSEACRVHVSGTGAFSAGTILVDGILYTTAWRTTMAVQPTNCDVIWKSIYTPVEKEIYNANRGVAYWDGRIFRGTGDGRLIAYDAATGRELLHEKVADPAIGEYLDAAPVAWDGKVFIGTAAGDLGIVGRMMAFDANTGRQLWSFDTIQPPDKSGKGSWLGDSWKTGGGGTWSSYTLEPDGGLLFVPVGNPAPAFDAHIRAGDNLFTDSVVALDARTGKKVWHFQLRKNDNHDYDIAPPPVLLDVDHRKFVAIGSKDGYLYLVDRTRDTLVWKTAVTTILNEDADATPEGVKVCPGAKGGISYNSPAYDPNYGLLIVGSVDWCYKLVKTPYGAHVPGAPYMGGSMERADDLGSGWITALDIRTGKIKWRYHTPAPVIAGITPTAGGLTFVGDAGGHLDVFRTSDGALLRTIDTGGALAGGIITYRSHGHEYIAVDSGNVSRSSWGAVGGIPTLIVYRLPESERAASNNMPANFDVLTPDAGNGSRVFQANCAACHGATGQGGVGPKLAGISLKHSQSEVAKFIAHPASGMPNLFPGTLSAQDVADVAAYVRSLPP